jgi:RNA polymerase primary sigma factor
MKAIDQFYLDSYGREPLLTAKEEIILARAIQRAKEPKATSSEKRAGLRAKNRMIQANMRLAISLAMKFLPRCNTLDLHDLVQESAIGLGHAVDKFDPSRGYKFSTYAYWWIRQGLNRAIWDQDRSIRVPPNSADGLFRMRRLMQEAAAQGKPITPKEAAQAASITVETAEMAAMASGVHSLNYRKDGVDAEIIDLLPAPTVDDYPGGLGVDQDHLLEIVRQLPEPQGYVVSAYFGLHDLQPKSITRIGRDLGVTRQTATNHKDKALRRIRRALYLHGITA